MARLGTRLPTDPERNKRNLGSSDHNTNPNIAKQARPAISATHTSERSTILGHERGYDEKSERREAPEPPRRRQFPISTLTFRLCPLDPFEPSHTHLSPCRPTSLPISFGKLPVRLHLRLFCRSARRGGNLAGNVYGRIGIGILDTDSIIVGIHSLTASACF